MVAWMADTNYSTAVCSLPQTRNRDKSESEMLPYPGELKWPSVYRTLYSSWQKQDTGPGFSEMKIKQYYFVTRDHQGQVETS